MKAQTVFLILVTLIRFYLGIKVISWMIINLISETPHPITEIDSHLILILLDTWFSSQYSQIIIREEKEDKED